jgi:hypothetical protein
MKPIECLVAADLEASPVWEFCQCGQTTVQPVNKLPVKSLAGRAVATKIRLANGSDVWGVLGNVNPNDAYRTEHFLTLSVLKDNEWFTLARYFDFDYAERGPEGLAHFLGLRVDDVFPIYYDIIGHVKGDPAALSGTIPREPREKLTRAQIIAMAVERKNRRPQ